MFQVTHTYMHRRLLVLLQFVFTLTFYKQTKIHEVSWTDRKLIHWTVLMMSSFIISAAWTHIARLQKKQVLLCLTEPDVFDFLLWCHKELTKKIHGRGCSWTSGVIVGDRLVETGKRRSIFTIKY